MSTKETRVGNDAGVSRCDIRENERHNRICLSVFDDERDQKRERDVRILRRVFVRAYVSRPILLPRRGNPFRRSKFVNTRKKERKKERTMRGRSISSSRMTRTSVVSASVSSLGQFYRYLVRLHHGTDASTQRTTSFKFHLNDDEEEEGKEKRERSKTRSASLNNALDI